RDIADFCESKYDVSFPMFEKIDVNGAHAHPLYNYLKTEKSGLLGSSIKWNFTKFLVDRSGKVVARHAPTAAPQGLKKEIEALLRTTRTKPKTRNCRTGFRSTRAVPITMSRSWRATSASASRVSRRPMSRNIVSAKAGCASPPATPRIATAIR